MGEQKVTEFRLGILHKPHATEVSPAKHANGLTIELVQPTNLDYVLVFHDLGTMQSSCQVQLIVIARPICQFTVRLRLTLRSVVSDFATQDL